MGDERPILFLCPHNAAKSVIAAAYCERLSADGGLTLRATSAGTDPDLGVSPGIAGALLAEGIDAIAGGFQQMEIGDHEKLDREFPYDALYVSCGGRWPMPKPTARV